MPDLHFEIPEIAKGTVVPYGVQEYIRLQDEKKTADRKARLYFWCGIVSSVLCMVGGYLLGKFC